MSTQMVPLGQGGAIGTYTDPLVHGQGAVADISQYTGGHLSGFGAHERQPLNRRTFQAAKLFADVYSGRQPRIMLQEAMNPKTPFIVNELMRQYPGIYGDPGARNIFGLKETMSVTDYQALYVDVLDRMYYGYYQIAPVPNKVLCKVHTLRDFRLVSRYMLDGMVSPFTAIDPAAPVSRTGRALTGADPQDGHPPTSTAPVQYQPKAYQSETAVNWRAFVNDDLGIFNDIANRLAIAGTRGTHLFITQQFCDTNGPHASLYNANYGNIINIANGATTNNPPFSAQGVSDGLKVLAGMKDASGYPILMGGKLYLWYGPTYIAAAQNMKRALTIQLSVEGGTANTAGFPSQFVNVENWIMNDLELVLDQFIPIVVTGANKSTTWGLTVDPNGLNRPAVELGFLSGFETPQMYRKLPNTLRVDGGVETLMGDYYTMDQETKIVGVFGAAQMDGRSTVSSNGSGS